jgi:hypothetical protein
MAASEHTAAAEPRLFGTATFDAAPFADEPATRKLIDTLLEVLDAEAALIDPTLLSLSQHDTLRSALTTRNAASQLMFYSELQQMDVWIWIAGDGINVARLHGLDDTAAQIARALFYWEHRHDANNSWLMESDFGLIKNIARFAFELRRHADQEGEFF